MLNTAKKPGEIELKRFICDKAAELHLSESAIWYQMFKSKHRNPLLSWKRIRRCNPRVIWVTP